jgi:hypothetical protein
MTGLYIHPVLAIALVFSLVVIVGLVVAFARWVTHEE